MSNANTTSPRPRTRRLAWLAVAVITGMLAVTSSTATASAPTDTSAIAEPVDIAVASYAADYSVTHKEAQRRLDRIQPLQEILASIRKLESARLAGWGIDHTGTFTGWVWLTGDGAPSAGAAGVADAHADVQIRTGAVHRLAELLAAQTDLFEDVGPTGHITDGPESLARIKRVVTFTGIDMRANAIQIGIDPGLATTVPGGLTDASPITVTDETLQAKITEVTQQLQVHINVKYSVEDGRRMAPEASFAGGENIGSTEKCTSGFAARKNGRGAYGIITAGHCGDNGPNETHTFRMWGVVLPHNYGWASVNADAQFHTIPTGSGHVLDDDYLCHNTPPINYCDVAGDIGRSGMIDDYVCHTGRSSGITCGTVVDTAYQPTYTGACRSSGNDATSCNRVFVKVEGSSLRSCRGDSGGPWYRNGTAYGIHMASNSSNDCSASGIFAIFSGIRDVENFLSVQILTGGSVTIP